MAFQVVFMGSGDIGIPALNWLIESSGCTVQAVFTQPDRPSGRKMLPTPTAIKVLALERNIPVHQPEKLRSPAAFAPLRELAPSLVVVMAYGQILRREVIQLPTVACINLHASLLPRHRGASPIQAAIRAGDAETGVTVMYIDEGLDTGDILLQETCPIGPSETGGELHDRLGLVAAKALARAVPLLREHSAPRLPQDPARVTYFGKLSREDGLLPWSESADSLEGLVRAYDPWPGTFTGIAGRKLKVFPPVRVLRRTEDGPPPGTILSADSAGLVVACGRDALQISDLQLEGKTRQRIDEFLRGHASLLATGSVVG